MADSEGRALMAETNVRLWRVLLGKGCFEAALKALLKLRDAILFIQLTALVAM